MLKFLCLLSVVLAPAASQADFGPFHATADDFANVYWSSTPDDLTQLNNEVLDNWQHSFPLGPFPQLSATALVVAASNLGTWGPYNPAGIILSSDPGASPRIVSDNKWFCKGSPDIALVSRKKWSSSPQVKTLIKAALTGDKYKSWLPAVEIYKNFVFGGWGIRDKIPLGASWIWADGLGEGEASDLPPENVICILDLRPGSG